MTYTYEWKPSPNFKKGRGGAIITDIIIHHWGIDGQKHDNIVNYLCRKGGNTSAHYVASAGRVTQLVKEEDRAWHAGARGNPIGIGIECRPEASDDDVETVRALIRDIQSRYGGKLKISCHSDFVSTDCPGQWYELVKSGALSASAARSDSVAGGDDEMICLLQLDDETGMRFYDGGVVHPLSNADEMEAIKRVYKATHGGRDIPVVKLGSKDAPFGHRFLDAVTRESSHKRMLP